MAGTGEAPDFNVTAMDKNDDTFKGQIGVAWINEDGTIAIKLNPFIVLDTNRHNLTIRLFPNERKAGGPVKRLVRNRKPTDELVKEEIPF